MIDPPRSMVGRRLVMRSAFASCARRVVDLRHLLSKLRYNFEVEVPQKGSHLSVVPKTGTHDQ